MSRPSRSVLGLERLEDRRTPAAVGALDPSFGTGGLVTTAVRAGDLADTGSAVALQSDGKVVVAGTAAGSSSDFALARYNPDGTLDATFGSGGRMTYPLGAAATATSVAVQSDGKILVTGYVATLSGSNPNNFAVIRVNANGTPDTTFNGTGEKTVDFGSDDRATGVAVQSDGKILVVGTTLAGTRDFAVARLNPDGSLDSSFGSGGLGVYDLGGNDFATAVVMQSDGKAVVSGYTSAGGLTENDFVLLRLDVGGGRDASFHGTGSLTIDFGADDRATAEALQSDGKVVVAGYTDAGSAGYTYAGSTDFAVARVNANGTLDASFSGDGLVTYNFGGVDQAQASGVAIQSDGRVVVVGTTRLLLTSRPLPVLGPGDFAVLRLTSTGGLDPSFHGDSQQTIDFGGDDSAAGVALTPTGRIVVAGTTGRDGVGEFAVARLIGTVELGRNLAVGGSPDGTATIYTPAPGTSGYTVTPAGTVNPFGSITVPVRTAVADVDGDGVQDTILVTGAGTVVRMAIVSGRTGALLVAPFAPLGGFKGGAFVAAADFDGDGKAEVVLAPDKGGGPNLLVFGFSGGTFVRKAIFVGLPGGATFRGGLRVAAGDINGDGRADLAVTTGLGGGPVVEVFDGRSVLTTQALLFSPFFALSPNLRNGGWIAVGDVDGDGFADIAYGAGPNGGAVVQVIRGSQLTHSGGASAVANPLALFFVGGDTKARGGVRVAFKDVDGDNKADLVAGAGENQPSRVHVYPGFAITGPGEPTSFQILDPFGKIFPGGIYVG